MTLLAWPVPWDSQAAAKPVGSRWTLYDDGYWTGANPFGWPANGWMDEDIDLHHAYWHDRR